MAVEKDRSDWLPQPPPPRPARRDAAIDAALRKFDGIEEPAAVPSGRPRHSWASTHHPQLAVVASAMLLVVVGIPAALIGLRNQPSTPEPEPRPTVAYHAGRTAPPAQSSPRAAADVVAEPNSTPRPRSLPPVPKHRGGDAGVVARSQSAPAVVAAAPPAEPAAPTPMAVAAPPAPPPPPPPAAEASRQSSGQAVANNVIVTGTRIPRPALSAPQGFDAKTAERANADEAAPAKPSFVPALSRLQAAVRANDRHQQIALIAFPLRVNEAAAVRTYSNAQAVERDFDRIFTARVRRAILNQRPDRLIVRGGRAMIGNGELWLAPSCPNAACSPPGPVHIVAVSP